MKADPDINGTLQREGPDAVRARHDQVKKYNSGGEKPELELEELDIWDAGDDPGLIPPRQWLLANQFCLGFISSIVAAGGTGKSALRLLQYISLATERALCGQHVFRRCRILLISLEDDVHELQRRIKAVLDYHEVERRELKGWLRCSCPKLTKLAELKGKARAIGPLERHFIFS